MSRHGPRGSPFTSPKESRMTQHGPWGHAPLSALKPYARNARQHSEAQINKIADSIKRFGFTNPILIDEDHNIVAGHGRAAAAKKLGLEVVPVVRLAQMSEQDKRAYILADNRLAELAHWDKDHLASELEGLLAADFEIDVVGFEPAEIDLIIEEASAADVHASHDKEDNLPALVETATTRLGDAWLLGRHRLLCG
ncbi:MAG: ParB/Srx family N-terminal domain-containing protein, partial [Hyphomonadaceae bacterium]